MSGGADFLWRRQRGPKIVEGWRPPDDPRSGDEGSDNLALTALQRQMFERRPITAADFSPEMLECGESARALRETVLADAMQLPFPDESFDCVTVAFENCTTWRTGVWPSCAK